MKFTKMGEWCESSDGERFYDGFNTKEKAIEFVQEEYGEGYIGESVDVEFTADDFNWDADCALGELLDKINNTDNINCFDRHYEEEAVAIVEKWSAEHPKKTRQSEFLKIFPTVIQLAAGNVSRGTGERR